MKFTMIDLSNGKFALSFQVDNVQRQEIDDLINVVHREYQKWDKNEPLLCLYDASNHNVVLTDYLKRVTEVTLPELPSVRGAIAVVLPDSTAAIGLRFFLNRLLSSAALPRQYHLFTNIHKAEKWLFEQSIIMSEQIPENTPSALIVEDDPRITTLYSKILNKENFKYRMIGRGDYAMDMLHFYSPHVILLDMFLPGANGFEVLEFIRNTPKLNHTIVIALSANALVDKMLEKGADYTFRKPVSPRELSNLLAEIREDII